MQDDDFLAVEDHFDCLVDGLNARDLKAYKQCKHNRAETAYIGRNFLVYTMVDALPEVIDRLIVDDFHADGDHGASMVLVSTETKRTVEVGYTPTKLFEYPIFSWLPLHSTLRWGATGRTLHKGSLGFPIVLRTRSRFNLQEEGVIYCETGKQFGEEFDSTCAE